MELPWTRWEVLRLFPGDAPLANPKSESCSVLSDSLQPYRLHSPWNCPGQNTGVDSCSLLQGIFPTQELNPGLPHCRQILYYLSHKGNPRILEWVAYPFSSRSSQCRNRTGVSCIAGGFFTSWAMRKIYLKGNIFNLLIANVVLTRKCISYLKIL